MKKFFTPFLIKMTVFIHIVTLFSVIILYSFLANAGQVFRHGDRTPTETYASDPYLNYNWPDGWGALTTKGKNQLYELGATLRERYNIFFGQDVSPNALYVRSSDADRCHMSGATFLAGLLPPTESHIWNSEIYWQPIPIHSLPRNIDHIVAMKKKCPTYDKALIEAYKSEEIQALNKENEDLYKYLTVHTGQDMYNITAVEFLFNTLEIEESNGLKLPAWTESIYPEKLKKLAIRSLEIFTETEFMKKMKGGVMLKEMIENTIAKQENKLKSDRKMYIYSAHDITLINFLRTLDLAYNLKPEYGAAFILEVHSSESNDFELKMLYYNSSSSKEPYILKMGKCGEPCYLSNFIKVTEQLVPKDWEQECKF